DDAPVISGGDTASVSAAENQNLAATVFATDQDKDTIVYSVIGGADASQFTINSSTGKLTFNSNPDFENPTDANDDGKYEVTVQASDGKGGIDTQAITVTVTNVNEAPVAIDDDNSKDPVVENTDATASGNVLANDT